jgi:hypothetical protein
VENVGKGENSSSLEFLSPLVTCIIYISELKSVEIWKRKQSWLERYEEVYDSRNIFRKEENTLVEYNNRGYNCFSTI